MALFHSDKGSVGYTIVGSPTIVDGVASGFSADDKLSISTSCDFKQVTSIVCKIKLPSSALGTDAWCVPLSGGIQFAINTGASGATSFRNGTFNANGMGDIRINHNLDPDTWYWVRYSSDGTTSTASWSTDGINYTPGDSKLTSTITSLPGGFTIGSAGSWRVFPGEIDLNATYITVNGQAWFGVCPVEVKHLVYRTPVDYTVVGSPTISNGVVSGFSGSDYLTLPGSFLSAQEFEIVGGINLNTSSPSGGYIPIFQSNGYGVIFCVTTEMKLGSYLSSTGNSWDLANITTFVGTTTLSANTNYLAKLKKTSTAYELWLKQGNNDWNLEATLSSTATIVSSPLLRIGYGSRAFQGSIDLNSTYIKINGKLWFFHPATNYLVKDDKLVFADSGLYLSGPVNYTKVGSPTIVDNVASGFSTSNYLKVGSGIPSISSFELNIKFTVPSTYVDNATLLSYSTVGIGYLTAYCMLVGNGYIGAYLFKKSDNTQQRYDAQYDLREHLNETFTFNIKTDMSSVYVNLYNANGILVRTDTYSNQNLGGYISSYILIGVRDGLNNPFNGSIDLNETYIKVNGSLWFYGKNYASQNIAPVPGGYTLNNTSHPYIGYYDMRDQSYHQAPAGTALVLPGGKATYDDYVIEDNKLVAVNPNIYLESTGTQYINTGVQSAFDTLKIETAFMETQGLTPEVGFFGGKSSGNTQAPTIFHAYGSTAFNTWCGSGTSATITNSYSLNTKYDLMASWDGATGRTWSLNDVSGSSSTIANDARYNPGNLAIFADGSVPVYFFAGRIYRFKIERNGELVRDLVAVPQGLVIGSYTVPSNGMFDIVTQQFYPNAGTGTFTIGRDE